MELDRVISAEAERLRPRAEAATLTLVVEDLTPAVVLGISLLEPGNWHWAANRAVDVIAGTVVAVVVGFLLGGRGARGDAPLRVG